ncbi:MAG: hypothetical protein NVSMB52_17120 [Chloroflexota bacterium]
MSTNSLVDLYEQHIKPLSPADRLRLVAMTTQDLVQPSANGPMKRTRSIKELHGLGREIWKGVDAQEYVDSLRNEWDRP